MTTRSEEGAQASIDVACRELKLPTVRAEAASIAEQALRAKLTHRAYLADVLVAELDDRAERRRERRVQDARFPRIKALSDFDCGRSPVTEATAMGAGFLDGVAAGVWPDLEAAASRLSPEVVVGPARRSDRDRWLEARARAERQVPELSALEF